MAALNPPVYWAQRNDNLFLTISLDDIRQPEISFDENKLIFSAVAGPNRNNYHLECEFYKDVDPKQSKQNLTGRELFFNIKKKESGPYWPRLLKNAKKPGWLKVDFNKWKDEDESEDDGDVNQQQQQPNFDQMLKQMGDGGLSPGLADSEDLEPSDEDSDDNELPDLESEDAKA